MHGHANYLANRIRYSGPSSLEHNTPCSFKDHEHILTRLLALPRPDMPDNPIMKYDFGRVIILNLLHKTEYAPKLYLIYEIL